MLFNYCCNSYDYKIKYKSDLINTLIVSTKIKHYICWWLKCEQSVAGNSGLKTYQLIHSEIKQSKQRFNTNENLKNFPVIHKNVKQCKCDFKIVFKN